MTAAIWAIGLRDGSLRLAPAENLRDAQLLVVLIEGTAVAEQTVLFGGNPVVDQDDVPLMAALFEKGPTAVGDHYLHRATFLVSVGLASHVGDRYQLTEQGRVAFSVLIGA